MHLHQDSACAEKNITTQHSVILFAFENVTFPSLLWEKENSAPAWNWMKLFRMGLFFFPKEVFIWSLKSILIEILLCLHVKPAIDTERAGQEGQVRPGLPTELHWGDGWQKDAGQAEQQLLLRPSSFSCRTHIRLFNCSVTSSQYTFFFFLDKKCHPTNFPHCEIKSRLKSHLIINLLFKGRITTRCNTTRRLASNIYLLHLEKATKNKKLTSQQELWNSRFVHSPMFPINCSVAVVASFAFALWSHNKEPAARTSWFNVCHRGPFPIFWPSASVAEKSELNLQSTGPSGTVTDLKS